MAIIPGFNPPSGTGSQPKQVEIAPETFKHNLIDTRKVAISDILTMIKGAPWTVVYFQQILGASQQSMNYQSLTLQVYQQYRKINNLVVAVQQDLQSSQDVTSAEFKVTGRAITYPRIVPNQYDHFFASMRDGQMGLFVVTEVERKSIYEQSAHEIGYELVAVITPELANIFESRVVETLYFNMNLLRNNVDPFLNPDENVVYHQLRQEFNGLCDRMTRLYYNNYTGTLMIPDQGSLVYDPFLVKAFQGIFTPKDHTSKMSMSHYRVDSLTAHNSMTIWDILFKRSNILADIIVPTLRLIPSNAFARLALYGSVYFSPVQFVMFPEVESVSLESPPQVGMPHTFSYVPCPSQDEDGVQPTGLFTSLGNEGTGSTITKEIVDPNVPEETIEVPYLKLITEDDYYVFSESFYNALRTGNRVNCSILELMVLDYLERKPLFAEDLKTLCTDIKNWSNLQKFYYMPVLGVLLQNFIGEM